MDFNRGSSPGRLERRCAATTERIPTERPACCLLSGTRGTCAAKNRQLCIRIGNYVTCVHAVCGIESFRTIWSTRASALSPQAWRVRCCRGHAAMPIPSHVQLSVQLGSQSHVCSHMGCYCNLTCPPPNQCLRDTVSGHGVHSTGPTCRLRPGRPQPVTAADRCRLEPLTSGAELRCGHPAPVRCRWRPRLRQGAPFCFKRLAVPRPACLCLVAARTHATVRGHSVCRWQTRSACGVRSSWQRCSQSQEASAPPPRRARRPSQSCCSAAPSVDLVRGCVPSSWLTHILPSQLTARASVWAPMRRNAHMAMFSL